MFAASDEADEENCLKDSETSEDNKISKVFKNKLVMKEMELKLVAEIKERADHKNKNLKESPLLEPILAVSGISHDPAAQLINELSQTFNLEKVIDKKDSSSLGNAIIKSIDSSSTNFTSHLKKPDPILKKTVHKDVNEYPPIIDFKSRLRKVENNTDRRTEQEEDNQGEQTKHTEMETESNKRESTASSDSGNLKMEDLDDKRKSTGSISSLKKLWEPRDTESSVAQLSPKLTLKNSKNEESNNDMSLSLDGSSEDTYKIDKTARTEKRVWPPNGEDKPIIPTKPPFKNIKPIIASRPAGSAIYATPIPSSNSKPPISAKPIQADNKTPEDDTKVNTDKGEKENILEISQTVESTLNSIKTNPSVSTAAWLQLSDKISLLHGSCMDYADNVVPAHTKFQFRELLTRLEAQARHLRSAATRNTSENVRCLNEVNITIKDVVNVVFR